MLSWALTFLVVALIAGALGFFHVAAISTEVAWTLFVLFIILFVISLVFRAGPGRAPPPPI